MPRYYIDWNGREQADADPDSWEQEPHDWNDEPALPEEPPSLTRYTLWSQGNGTITGTAWTNDNLDEGWPSEEASWEVQYPDLASAIQSTGGTHQGIGAQVTVTLDGIAVDAHGQSLEHRCLTCGGVKPSTWAHTAYCCSGCMPRESQRNYPTD